MKKTFGPHAASTHASHIAHNFMGKAGAWPCFIPLGDVRFFFTLCGFFTMAIAQCRAGFHNMAVGPKWLQDTVLLT